MSAVTLMLLSSAAFATMSALVKALGPAFPFFEAIFIRGALGLPLMLWLLRRAGQDLRSEHKRTLALRGGLGWIGMSAYFFGLQRGKLAEVSALLRTEPLLIAVLSPLLLGERAPGSTWLLSLLGFAGVTLVLKPTPAAFEWSSAAGLVAGLFSCLAHLAVRRLNATEPPLRIVFYMTVVVTVCSAPALLFDCVVPSATQWLVLVGVTICATAGQVTMTMAYGRDRAPVVAAVGYASVVFALVLGLVIWRELPDVLSLLGATAVIATGVGVGYSRHGLEEPAAKAFGPR